MNLRRENEGNGQQKMEERRTHWCDVWMRRVEGKEGQMRGRRDRL